MNSWSLMLQGSDISVPSSFHDKLVRNSFFKATSSSCCPQAVIRVIPLNSSLVFTMLGLTSKSLTPNSFILAFLSLAQLCQTPTAQLVLLFVFSRILLSLIFSSCSSVTNDVFPLFSGLRYSKGSLNSLSLAKPAHSVVHASKS